MNEDIIEHVEEGSPWVSFEYAKEKDGDKTLTISRSGFSSGYTVRYESKGNSKSKYFNFLWFTRRYFMKLVRKYNLDVYQDYHRYGKVERTEKLNPNVHRSKEK